MGRVDAGEPPRRAWLPAAAAAQAFHLGAAAPRQWAELCSMLGRYRTVKRSIVLLATLSLRRAVARGEAMGVAWTQPRPAARCSALCCVLAG